jgi:hypothetical protein
MLELLVALDEVRRQSEKLVASEEPAPTRAPRPARRPSLPRVVSAFATRVLARPAKRPRSSTPSGDHACSEGSA